MRQIDVRGFRPGRAWAACELMGLGEYSARMHWTDAAFAWHANAGEELFVVLDGAVDMHWRDASGAEQVTRLESGAAMHFDDGDEHSAAPVGEARVLVIERRESA